MTVHTPYPLRPSSMALTDHESQSPPAASVTDELSHAHVAEDTTSATEISDITNTHLSECHRVGSAECGVPAVCCDRGHCHWVNDNPCHASHTDHAPVGGPAPVTAIATASGHRYTNTHKVDTRAHAFMTAAAATAAVADHRQHQASSSNRSDGMKVVDTNDLERMSDSELKHYVSELVDASKRRGRMSTSTQVGDSTNCASHTAAGVTSALRSYSNNNLHRSSRKHSKQSEFSSTCLISLPAAAEVAGGTLHALSYTSLMSLATQSRDTGAAAPPHERHTNSRDIYTDTDTDMDAHYTSNKRFKLDLQQCHDRLMNMSINVNHHHNQRQQQANKQHTPSKIMKSNTVSAARSSSHATSTTEDDKHAHRSLKSHCLLETPTADSRTLHALSVHPHPPAMFTDTSGRTTRHAGDDTDDYDEDPELFFMSRAVRTPTSSSFCSSYASCDSTSASSTANHSTYRHAPYLLSPAAHGCSDIFNRGNDCFVNESPHGMNTTTSSVAECSPTAAAVAAADHFMLDDNGSYRSGVCSPNHPPSVRSHGNTHRHRLKHGARRDTKENHPTNGRSIVSEKMFHNLIRPLISLPTAAAAAVAVKLDSVAPSLPSPLFRVQSTCSWDHYEDPMTGCTAVDSMVRSKASSTEYNEAINHASSDHTVNSHIPSAVDAAATSVAAVANECVKPKAVLAHSIRWQQQQQQQFQGAVLDSELSARRAFHSSPHPSASPSAASPSALTCSSPGFVSVVHAKSVYNTKSVLPSLTTSGFYASKQADGGRQRVQSEPLRASLTLHEHHHTAAAAGVDTSDDNMSCLGSMHSLCAVLTPRSAFMLASPTRTAAMTHSQSFTALNNAFDCCGSLSHTAAVVTETSKWGNTKGKRPRDSTFCPVNIFNRESADLSGDYCIDRTSSPPSAADITHNNNSEDISDGKNFIVIRKPLVLVRSISSQQQQSHQQQMQQTQGVTEESPRTDGVSESINSISAAAAAAPFHMHVHKYE